MDIPRTIFLIWVFCCACLPSSLQGFELSEREKELGISPDFPKAGSTYMGFFENGSFTSEFVFETYDPATETFHGYVTIHRIVMPMTQFHPLKDYVVRRRVFSMHRTETHEWEILTHKRIPARDPAHNIRWIQTNMGPMLTGSLVNDFSRTAFGIFPEQRENWHRDRFIQREILQPETMTGGYIKNYTASEGLPHNATRCITQTADGAIWIGTIAGLSRFDGSTFINFHTNSDPPLPDNNVRKLLELSDGRLAVATKTDGLFIFDGNQFQRTPLTWSHSDQERTPLPISGLAQSESGAIWVQDSRFIYCVRPDGSFIQKSIDDLNPNWGGPYTYQNQIGTVLPLTDHIALVAASGQLIRWNIVLDKMSYSSNPDEGVGYLLKNNKEEIVWLTASGFRHIDFQLNVERSFGLNEKGGIPAIFNGNFNPGYWAYNSFLHSGGEADARCGLFHINEGAAVGYDAFPKNLNVVEFMEDREGNIWAALGSSGVTMFTPPLVENKPTQFDLLDKLHVEVSKSHQLIKIPTKEKNSEVSFIGLDDLQKIENLPEHYRDPIQQFISPLKSGAHLFTPLGQMEPDSRFYYYALEPTEAYRTQLSSSLGEPGFAVLLKTDHQNTIQWYFCPEAPEGIQYLHSAGISETHGIFLATNKGILCKRPDESEFSYWKLRNSSAPFKEEVRAIWVDSSDRIWIAGAESGIYTEALNWSSGKFESYRIKNSSANATVVFQDKKGNIWAGSEKSICLIEFDGKEFKAFQREWPAGNSHSGPHHYRSLTEDHQTRLWFGLNYGILIIKSDSLERYVKKQTETLVTKILDSKSGLTNVSSEYIFYPRSGVDSEGRIHLEMLDNIVIVDPEKVPDASPPAPSATINRVVSAKEVFFNNPFFSPMQYSGLENAFPAGSGQTLSFDFSAANISPSNKIRFSHRLKGHSDRWSSPQLYNTAIFSKVPPGQYQFEVRAISGNGMIQQKATTFAFSIRPFFYETKTFKSLSALLAITGLVCLVFHLDKKRRQKLISEKNREIEIERTRITQHMHDDIGSTLARLRMRLEMAKNLDNTVDPNLLSDLTSLAQESSKKMRQLIWCSRTDTCTFNDLADYLSNLLTDFFQATPIKVQLDIQDSENDIHVGSAAKREWSLMLQNLAANVLQHSKADRLQFYLREIDGEWIEMKLIDNGIGLPPNAMSKAGSTGLKSVQSRIESQDGQFEMNSGSDSNTGVSIIIRIPVSNQNTQANKWSRVVRFLLKL